MELCIQLGIIMIGEQVKDSLVEILSPWYRLRQKKPKDKGFNFKKFLEKYDYKQAETDYELLSWSTTDFAAEYLEMGKL